MTHITIPTPESLKKEAVNNLHERLVGLVAIGGFSVSVEDEFPLEFCQLYMDTHEKDWNRQGWSILRTGTFFEVKALEES